MNTKSWNTCSIILLSALVFLARPVAVRAAEGDETDRLARLEQRVNQIAERQEQLLNRLGGSNQDQRPSGGPNLQNPAPQPPPSAAPQAMPGNPRAELVKSIHDFLGLLFFIGVICNILLAIWIFTDIRKRGEGSGLFIVLALVAGVPAALIYSLTRIGDRRLAAS